MNVLFYVEPLIELEKPYFKENWVNGVCYQLIEALQAKGHEVSAVTSDSLSQFFRNKIEIIIFDQAELLCDMKYNYLDLSSSWYKGDYDQEQLNYYKNLMKCGLKDLTPPQVIFTFSPIPFLEELYPDSLVLHLEYSIFSRSPFPKTWYLDPVGKNGGAFLDQNWSKIVQKLVISEHELNLVKTLKEEVQNLIVEKSPFRELIQRRKEGFSHLLLLPLQFSRYYLFDALTHYKSQFDYLIDVLNKVPANIGVIVTSHPEYVAFTDEMIRYLERKYPNFIYDYEFENYYAASQYLINEVDAVVTVSSSVGLQTLLWDKKLISLGDKFLTFMADSRSLENLDELLQAPNVKKDNILFWILTRYAITEEYLFDSDWLHSFITDSFLAYNQDGNDFFDFYRDIDDVDTVFQKLSKSIGGEIPEFAPGKGYRQLENLYRTRDIYLIECYWDQGNGYSEANCIKERIQLGYKKYNISLPKKYKSIRIDPLNTSGVVRIHGIFLRSSTHEMEVEVAIETTNAEYTIGDVYYFLNSDPQVYLDVQNQVEDMYDIVVIEIEYININFIEAAQLKRLLSITSEDF